MVQELARHLIAPYTQRLHQQLKQSLRLVLHHHQLLLGTAPLYSGELTPQPQTYLRLALFLVRQVGTQETCLVNVTKKGTNE
jgi:hypothetical protein